MVEAVPQSEADDAEQCRLITTNLAIFVIAPEHLTAELLRTIHAHLKQCASCRRELNKISVKQGLVV